MGGLKPIGSEKLNGMDKIRRIMEIANYNHQLPNKDIELKSTEYQLSLADGNSYEIVKERQGYIIKRNITESYSDYIEPMKNRRYYRSYSEALKKLNLMAKDFNSLYGNDDGTNLFTEQKKFKLKVKQPKAELEPQEAPTLPEPSTPPQMPSGPGVGGGEEQTPTEPGMESPTPEMGGGEPGMESPSPEMGGGEPSMEEPEMGGDETGMEEPEGEEMDMEEPEGEDKGVSFKMIQKLTGKLAQKIRKYLSDDELDSDDTKYILNSIISSLDIDVLSDEDVEEIIDRLEGEEEEGEEDSMDMEEPEMEEPEGEEPMGMETEPPMEPEGGEMKEYGYRNRNRMKVSPSRSDMFSESKVDNIIKNYFVISENEKKEINSKKLQRQKLLKENFFTNKMEIERLSISDSQEKSAMKFLKENPNAVLWGSTNKKNLVFRIGLEEHKISPNGRFVL